MGTKRTARLRGITLIECCVTMAIAAIVLASAAPGFANHLARKRLDGAASKLAADVRFARSEAARLDGPVRLTLQSLPWGTCWLVHTGPANACRCDASSSAACAGTAALLRSVAWPAGEGIAVTGNVGSIVFDPVHGTSSPAGTLQVTNAEGRSIRHVVSIMGRVRSCSPAPALSGYVAC